MKAKVTLLYSNIILVTQNPFLAKRRWFYYAASHNMKIRMFTYFRRLQIKLEPLY